MKLIVKLIAGIVFGILVGLFAPDWITRVLLTFKSLFGQLLFFTIPLLIVFYITSGIAGLPRNSGRLLGTTLGLAYGSTLVAGTVAFLTAGVLVPLLTGGAMGPAENEAAALTPFITVDIPPLFGIMSGLAAAFIFGLGIAATR